MAKSKKAKAVAASAASSVAPTNSFEWWAACAVALVVLVLAYRRIFFGVSIGDEAIYVTTAYLPWMGGRWYVDEMIMQQTASMLFSPLVYLWSLLNGTDGIMLFVRHLYFALSVVTAGIFFYALKLYLPRPLALLFSLSVIAFVPNSIASLSYNSMGSLFFGIATSLALLAFSQNLSALRTRLAISASAVAWVLAVFCYPTFVPTYLAFVFGAWWLLRGKNDLSLVKPFVVATLVVALPLLAWLFWIGFDNILASAKYSLPFNMPGGWWKLPFSASLAAKYLPPTYLIVGILAAWIYFRKHHFSWGAPALIAAYFVFGKNYEAPPSQVLWPLLLLLFLMVTLKYQLRFSPALKNGFWLLYVPGVVGAIAACLSSRVTLYAMCLTSIFAGLFVVAISVEGRRWAGWAAGLLLAGFSLVHYYENVYEDEKIPELTRTFESGPLKGLKTFPEKFDFINGIANDLKQFNIQGRKILFKDFFPMGYLMAANRPSGPSLYIAPANMFPEARPIYVNVFRQERYAPDVVVELAYYPVNLKSKWPYTVPAADQFRDPFKDFFIRSSAFKPIVERSTHRILERVKDSL